MKDPYSALPADDPLRDVLREFDKVGKRIGGWTCDGGANTLAHLLDRAGLHDYEVVVGKYWFGVERLDEVVGVVADEDEVAEWRELGRGYDEHHHWVEINGYVIDPNGEGRNEPRVQTEQDARVEVEVYPDAHRPRYEPVRPGEWRAHDYLSFSPLYEPPSDEDWEDGRDGEIMLLDEPLYDHEKRGWKMLGLSA